MFPEQAWPRSQTTGSRGAAATAAAIRGAKDGGSARVAAIAAENFRNDRRDTPRSRSAARRPSSSLIMRDVTLGWWPPPSRGTRAHGLLPGRASTMRAAGPLRTRHRSRPREPNGINDGPAGWPPTHDPAAARAPLGRSPRASGSRAGAAPGTRQSARPARPDAPSRSCGRRPAGATARAFGAWASRCCAVSATSETSSAPATASTGQRRSARRSAAGGASRIGPAEDVTRRRRARRPSRGPARRSRPAPGPAAGRARRPRPACSRATIASRSLRLGLLEPLLLLEQRRAPSGVGWPSKPPRPAPTPTTATTRSGNSTAVSKAIWPPRLLPTSAARPIPRASRTATRSARFE